MVLTDDEALFERIAMQKNLCFEPPRRDGDAATAAVVRDARRDADRAREVLREMHPEARHEP